MPAPGRRVGRLFNSSSLFSQQPVALHPHPDEFGVHAEAGGQFASQAFHPNKAEGALLYQPRSSGVQFVGQAAVALDADIKIWRAGHGQLDQAVPRHQ